MDDELMFYIEEPFEICLEDPLFRASFVHFLVAERRFEQAVEFALPLVGTTEEAWFLYARAWYTLAHGQIDEALELYRTAEERGSDFNWFDFRASFHFDDEGAPLPVFPFVSPLDYPDAHEPFLFEGSYVFKIADMLREGDWPKALRTHRRAKKKTLTLAEDLSFWIEQVLHLDFQGARTALKGMSLFTVERDEALRYLTVLFSSDDHLEAALEIFWRLKTDWGPNVALSEVVAYLQYLLSNDEETIEACEECLAVDPSSVIAGNLRALLLSEKGHLFAADDQWQRTLALNPERGATYLVIGWQALLLGQDGVAMRYFLEASHLGDNPYAAIKSLGFGLRYAGFSGE